LLDTPRIDHALLDDSGRVFWALSTALTGNDMIGTATVEDGSVVLATFDIRQAASLTDVSDNGFASFAVLDIQSVSGISTVSYRYSTATHFESTGFGYATAINNSGITAVATGGGSGAPNWFTISQPSTAPQIVFPLDGFHDVSVHDLNNDGVFAGALTNNPTSPDAVSRAFTYTAAAGYELLPDLPRERDRARHINASGNIIATSSTFLNETPYFIDQTYFITGDTHEVTEIMPLEGDDGVGVFAFNKNNIAVGVSYLDTSTATTPVLFHPDFGTVNLNDLLPELGVEIVDVFDINNRNELLVGYREFEFGEIELAIVPLTGIPSPGGVAVFGVAVGLGARRRR